MTSPSADRGESSPTGAAAHRRALALAVALAVALALVAVAASGCGTDHSRGSTAPLSRPASSPGTAAKASGPKPLSASPGLVASVERALHRNPHQAASSARCAAATAQQRRRAPFGTATRRPILRCTITWGGRPAEAYDLEVLGNGCFVAERVRPGRSDSGCGALRLPLPS